MREALDVDKAYYIIDFLLEAINREAQGRCFYKSTIEHFEDRMEEIHNTLMICQVPNKK